MFGNCTKLKSFTSDLSSLTLPIFMFGSNYETVERFIYDVLFSGEDIDISEISPEEMEYGINMYLQIFGSPTSLDIASVQNIAATINDITGITPPADLDPELAAMWGRIDIGIDPTLEGNSDIEAALTTIRNKGWDVTPMYGIGSTTGGATTPGEGLLKYNNCRTYEQCKTIDANVATDVDENGAWNYSLDNLKTGGGINMASETVDGLFVIGGLTTPNTSLVSFNVDLPKLTDGSAMFMGCTGLTSFTGALPNLRNGTYMFYVCMNLKSWNTPLPNLTYGFGMFAATMLTSWNIPLPNLTYGTQMFYLSDLQSFSGALPKLIDGSNMFYLCSNLTTFDSDLSSLTIGNNMFESCRNLTSFNSDLSSLTEG